MADFKEYVALELEELVTFPGPISRRYAQPELIVKRFREKNVLEDMDDIVSMFVRCSQDARLQSDEYFHLRQIWLDWPNEVDD